VKQMRKTSSFRSVRARRAAQLGSLSLSTLLIAGCKVDENALPTGIADGIGGSDSGSEPITAPIISDPLSGSTVTNEQPSLTVLNAARQTQDPVTYLFQVSSDSSFSLLEAQSAFIPEGEEGTTSWTVDRPLPNGQYFWRVRARSGVQDSPFSEVAQFELGGGGGSSNPPAPPPPSPAPSPGTILADPLVGGSVGEVIGGRFTSEGWEVTSPANFIRYEVPPIESGWAEFDVRGLRQINPNHDQFMLFGMWDPTAGDYRTNPFRVHVQKLHPDPHNPPYLRLRWIANGEQHDEGDGFYGWDPNRTYRFRIEWGPVGSGHQARVLIDDDPRVVVSYSRAYRPNVHWIELGIGERGESIVGAVYSNFRVGE
jgi:hypothetical protein